MPKLPPIKNTAGEGFAVEDAVVAWLSCHLLAGVPWPNRHAGTIRALHCQMRQDGWHFEDVVVEIVGGSVDFDIGCSVKSFPVFGPEGAPADFVAAIWKQWLSAGTPFKRGRDQLALFAAGHTHEIAETWKSLLDAAHTMTAETLARRHAERTEPSSSKRAAFASIRCPQALDASSYANREETARLLACLSLQEHDFDHSNSRSVAQAIALCQQSLFDSARERAGELWEAVLIFAGEVRQKGGTIDLPRLLSRLASRFPLKQHPSFAADWERMSSVSAEVMAIVPAKIGGIATVERRELLNRISNIAEPGRCAAILGGSGYGKTVLALAWVSLDPAATAIWIRSSDLTAPGGLRAVWSLRHGVAEIFANAAIPVRVVLDGLDRCFNDEAFGEAALVLKAISQPEALERCQIVITCRPDEWDRVRRHLIRHGIAPDFEAVQVREISQAELEGIARQIPALRALVQRPHLRSLLRWPKALDIVAMHWTDGNASPTWASESDFARWFWQSAITREERISTRGRVARKLATLIADRLSIAARVDEFAPEELVALRDLHQERHIEVDDIRQTVRFTHDLVADFARVRELQAQGDSAAAYLRTRLHSPFWHRAVRLYGLDLLEQQADSAEWERLFVQFSEQTPTDEMAQNLLLEAPVFALDQVSALDRLWPVLAADEGKLLRRFLRQFLRVATVPNEHILANFRDRAPDFQLEIAVRHRWPFIPYWLGVLGFLDAHCAEVVGLARREVAEVCLLWLPLEGATTLGMKHAANLAVTSARVFYRSGEKRYPSPDKVSAEEKVCEALLAAAPVMPEEVTELALKLSGRRLPDPDDGLSTKEPEHRSRSFPRPGPPRPWPEGPQISSVPVFCRAFMNGSAAEPFLDALPEVAAEVMFATLLDIPREGQPPNDTYDLDEHGFRRGELRHEMLFWTSGPFLTFLRVQPDVR
jgi:arsenate reductase-like glutaredoxin family protein